MNLTSGDKAILRGLAGELAELAALPCQEERRRMWEAHNTLSGGTKPLFLADQLPWHELDARCTHEHALIGDPYWRKAEVWLRREIYKGRNLATDMVIDPYVKLEYPYLNSGWGLTTSSSEVKIDPDSDVTSRHMYCQINEPEDIDKIKMPVITPCRAQAEQAGNLADETFAGILPWRFTGCVMHLGAWDSIAFWMSVENCYIELMDRPEMLHAIMERMTAGYISIAQQLNAHGLYDTCGSYCHCSHTYMPGETPERAPVSQNGWAFGLAQLFTSVSPKVTEEFECAYMKRIFPYFKHIYYGCCERLDDRLEIVSRLPNVRKISCSPWSRREEFAEKLPAHIVMSNKPTPVLLAEDVFDESAVRKEIRRTVDAARSYGKTLEMLLKDVSTVRYEPDRLKRYCEIASEEAER
ncbi:MAG: hypothetical protein IKR85_06015 [Clostridia bacterium]|nr:hypothetical protein [Clostridia bacterium]